MLAHGSLKPKNKYNLVICLNDNYYIEIPNTINMVEGHLFDNKHRLKNFSGPTKRRKINRANEFS
ncbi:MAG: hypothetical protein ACJAT0_000893 [Nonlabens sp.]|jgi:hypothetical protein